MSAGERRVEDLIELQTIHGQQISWSGKALAARPAEFVKTHGAGGDTGKLLANRLA